MTTVRVLAVRQSHRGHLWFVTTGDGQTLATRNAWVASLCARAEALGVPVELDTRAGWAFREIDFVRLPDGTSSQAQEPPLPKGA